MESQIKLKCNKKVHDFELYDMDVFKKKDKE